MLRGGRAKDRYCELAGAVITSCLLRDVVPYRYRDEALDRYRMNSAPSQRPTNPLKTSDADIRSVAKRDQELLLYCSLVTDAVAELIVSVVQIDTEDSTANCSGRKLVDCVPGNTCNVVAVDGRPVEGDLKMAPPPAELL